MACVASGHFFEREDKLLKFPMTEGQSRASYSKSRFTRTYASMVAKPHMGKLHGEVTENA